MIASVCCFGGSREFKCAGVRPVGAGAGSGPRRRKSDEGGIKVYVNGEVKGSASTPIVPNTTDVALTIGKTQGLAPNFADAMIDEVRIYKRALSAEEIAQQAKRYGATKK